MSDKLGFEWFVAFAAALGAPLGYWLFKNHEKGEVNNNAKIPIAGPMLTYTMWMPKNNYQWNILLTKAYIVLLTILATYIPFLFVTIIPLVLMHVDWLKEND